MLETWFLFAPPSKFLATRLIRWTVHCNSWKNPQAEGWGDLIKQFIMKHRDDINNNLPLLSDCYQATFVEQPQCENLERCDIKWIYRVKAPINLDRMILLTWGV